MTILSEITVLQSETYSFENRLSFGPKKGLQRELSYRPPNACPRRAILALFCSQCMRVNKINQDSQSALTEDTFPTGTLHDFFNWNELFDTLREQKCIIPD